MRSRVPNTGFVWGALRRVLPEGACEGVENVRSMRLTADGHGAVFDVKEEWLEHLAPTLAREGADAWLRMADGELPELVPSEPSGGKGGKSVRGLGVVARPVRARAL